MKNVVWYYSWCVLIAVPGAALLWIRDHFINQVKCKNLKLDGLTYRQCFKAMVWFQEIDQNFD